jgi:trans-2,3-dihydro-3-hydroxyanthranilate isomerase
MRRQFITADVFTDQPFGGNPLAVLPDARGLSTEQMQRLAREFNLSETTFVLPPDDPSHDKRVRIFVPTKEVPFAGHPTIGTALILAHSGAFDLDGDETSIIFEMKAGLVPVTIKLDDGRPASATLTAPQKPEIRPGPETALVADLLSLDRSDIVQTEAASVGLPFLLIEVVDRDALGRATINALIDQELRRDSWAVFPYIFTRDAKEGVDFQARMFAQREGIPEDPATGSAAAALGGWLGHHDPRQDGTIEKVINQGIEMGRPSRIDIAVDKSGGEVTAVRVSGGAVLISEGEIEEPLAR